jgi:hypothetical protein
MESRFSMKALVVCSVLSADLRQRLLAGESRITVAEDGPQAIQCAERSLFDVAVLSSTGPMMDVVETYFNLRDLNPSMEIVLLADDTCGKPDPLAQVIAATFPNTRLITAEELTRMLEL